MVEIKMNIDNGKLRYMEDDEMIEYLSDLYSKKLKEIPVDVEDLTSKQKKEMKVSIHDFKTKAGKKLHEARKKICYRGTKNQKRNIRKKLNKE
jgi:hypothetical protein